MHEADRDLAVALLAAAADTGETIGALPAGCRPRSVAEALAIQDALVTSSGKEVAGWKVATDPAGAVMYGAVYAEDCYPSPAAIDSRRYPLLGLEAELAYRFTRDLPDRGNPYTDGELEAVLAPIAAFEIVHSRYTSYGDTPVLDRLADRMSNGAMVLGPPVYPVDADLAVALTIDGVAVVDGPAAHSRGNPLLPALDFIRSVQQRWAFRRGQFITTGTLTGLRFLRRGQTAKATYDGRVTMELRTV